MEQNEKYGIELEAQTSAFKKALQNTANFIKSFSKNAKEDVKITPIVDKSGYDKQIEYVKRKMTSISKQIESESRSASQQVYDIFKAQLDKINSDIERQKIFDEEFYKTNPVVKKINPNYQTKEMKALLQERERIEKNLLNLQVDNNGEKSLKQLGLEAKYEQLSHTLNTLNQKQEEFNNNLDDTNKKSNKINLGQMFDKSIAKIKRFTYYLLGARSVFSLFMKYQSIYYQYSEQMQYQTELSQNAIALSLAPAFELLGNVMTYVSIAFAKFIELLTGINVLSKVSTKGIRDYNKSLKETQTLVSGVDEITNLNMPSGTGLADQYKALNDFQDKVKEVENWFEKTKKNLKSIWDYFDPVRGWNIFITEFPNMMKRTYDIAIASWLDPFIATLKENLRVVWEPLTNAFEETLNNIKIKWEEFLNISFVKKIYTTIENALIDIYNYIVPFLNDVVYAYNETLGLIFGKIDYLDYKVKNTADNITQEQKQALKEMGIDVDAYTTNSKIDIDAIKNKFKNLTDDQKKKLKEVGLDIDDVATKGNESIDSVQENIEDINDMKVNFSIGAVIKNAENTIRNFLSKLGINFGSGNLSTTIGLTVKAVGEKGVEGVINALTKNQHAQGLDYVPYDEYPAILHKGEAVVPAKYNPTIHSAGNDYTNSLLETVVMKLDDLSRRPNEFIIDGQKFANATYNLYETAKNQQNYVEGVVR